MKFIHEKNLTESLEHLCSGLAVTKGDFTFTVPGLLQDMEWNHMDQMHRPFIHHTYEEALRIAAGKDFAVSLTRWGRWPFFITVTDVRVAEGKFYQCMTLAGLLYVHLVIDMKPLEESVVSTISWRIASHWLLKWTHALLSRKFFKLNQRLQVEDNQIRVRRHALRKKGYRFKSDPPDYLSSNLVSSNTLAPPIPEAFHLDLSGVSHEPAMHVIQDHEFIVKRHETQGFLVWPGVCPHEGGELNKGHLCEAVISCPWHGLKFTAVHLTEAKPLGSRYGYTYQLNDQTLIISLSLEAMAVQRQKNELCQANPCATASV